MIDYDSIAQLSEIDAKLVRIIEVAKGALTALSHNYYAGAAAALEEIAKIERD